MVRNNVLEIKLTKSLWVWVWVSVAPLGLLRVMAPAWVLHFETVDTIEPDALETSNGGGRVGMGERGEPGGPSPSLSL